MSKLLTCPLENLVAKRRREAEEVVAVSGGGSPAETGRVPLRTNEPAPTKLDNEPLNPKLSGSVSGTTANSRGLLQTEKESWWGWQESHRAAAWGEQHCRWRESCGSNRCELSRESDGMIRQFPSQRSHCSTAWDRKEIGSV